MSMMENSWHLSKKLTVSLIAGILINVGGIVWATAKMDSRVDNIEVWKVETSENRFTAQDAINFEYRLQLAESTNRELLDKVEQLLIDVAVIKRTVSGEI